ncbi:MAG: type II toxin-antitoxin system PemK/MazF family toxin [Eubacteriales bacterium]
MARKLTKEELIIHKNESLEHLDKFLTSLINSNNKNNHSKADKLCFWIRDWVTFLNFEPSFRPNSLRRYKRGEIIKVHLGYNVGSEEGGLHYCVVMDKNNSLLSPIITIVPLTSVKVTTDLSKLHNGNIFLGNELFTNLRSKSTSCLSLLEKRSKELVVIKNSDEYKDNLPDAFYQQLSTCEKELALIKRMQSEIQKMKQGSIALVSQVTTVSKIRIYDPKTNYDVLSNVKLSNQKLDLLDDEICRLFTNKK